MSLNKRLLGQVITAIGIAGAVATGDHLLNFVSDIGLSPNAFNLTYGWDKDLVTFSGFYLLPLFFSGAFVYGARMTYRNAEPIRD